MLLIEGGPYPGSKNVSGALLNRAIYLRLSSALAMEQSEEWLTGHGYLNMQALQEAKHETTDVLLRAPVQVCALKQSPRSRLCSVMKELKIHTNLR